ncbi:E3 ubiquitin-protein ligase TRIM71 [Stylophora pistillata]|uniref:E3 ubiquitin-protein ligase TRIM71 n=1 Tax=Stylophora pistillata TaxID=50429 RepID=A0A2B4R6F7_STYPI|nr:E3 ubiquitin-protein ligase TRIM71 [Stylophora pistillata]
MDVKTLLDNLHDEVSCSVCMTTFAEPKILPCLHSFCLHCLNGILLRTSGRHDAFLCPECRREVQVPSSGTLKDLPTNFRINSLLDVLAIKECHTTGVKCGNCEKSSRHSSYCFQCCAFWCDECITAHNMIKANKEHRVLALKDFEDQDIEDVFKRPAFCQQKHHEKEELKFFCKNCDVAICNSCVATIHDGHAKILLEEAASERKLQVESLIELQKEKIQQKKNKIAVLERQCNHIEVQADAVKRDIHRLAENMIAAIETRRKEIQFRPLLSFGQKASSPGKLAFPYGVAVNERDEILVTNTSNHRVQVFSSDGIYLRSFGRKGDKQGEFNYPTGIAQDKNKNIIVVDTQNHSVQLFNDQGEYLSQFGGKGNLDHQLSSPYGLSVDGNGNIIVADRGNKCIKTFSSDGQFLYKLGEGEAFTAPFHCIQHNKHLIMSDKDEHYIKVFDINGDFLYKFGNKGNGDGQFDFPNFLSVNKAGHLMVCDTDNHRVQVFELSGKFVTKFGKRGDGPGEFLLPTCTAVLSDGRIVVADWFNHRIQILGNRNISFVFRVVRPRSAHRMQILLQLPVYLLLLLLNSGDCLAVVTMQNEHVPLAALFQSPNEMPHVLKRGIGEDAGFHRILPPRTPQRLKELCGQAKIFMRPVQKDIELDDKSGEERDADSDVPMINCFNCGAAIMMTDMQKQQETHQEGATKQPEDVFEFSADNDSNWEPPIMLQPSQPQKQQQDKAVPTQIDHLSEMFPDKSRDFLKACLQVEGSFNQVVMSLLQATSKTILDDDKKDSMNSPSETLGTCGDTQDLSAELRNLQKNFSSDQKEKVKATSKTILDDDKNDSMSSPSETLGTCGDTQDLSAELRNLQKNFSSDQKEKVKVDDEDILNDAMAYY